MTDDRIAGWVVRTPVSEVDLKRLDREPDQEVNNDHEVSSIAYG